MGDLGAAHARRVLVVERPEFEVLGAVVVPATVAMMDALAGQEHATERSPEHVPMLEDPAMPVGARVVPADLQ